MLDRENRLISNFFVLLLFLSLCSCKNDYENKKKYYSQKFDVLKRSDNYREVLSSSSDTIKHWVDLKLTFFYKFNNEVSWAKYEIDDWILFNSKMEKCLIKLLVQNIANKTQDDVYIILGEKYEGKWWFYDGPDLTIIQNNYINDTSIYALPFSTLREIALKNTLSRYYIEKPSGSCLKKLFSEGYDSYKKCSDEKYIINDEYFETGFNWEADRKNHSNFLKDRFQVDTVKLNQ